LQLAATNDIFFTLFVCLTDIQSQPKKTPDPLSYVQTEPIEQDWNIESVYYFARVLLFSYQTSIGFSES